MKKLILLAVAMASSLASAQSVLVSTAQLRSVLPLNQEISGGCRLGLTESGDGGKTLRLGYQNRNFTVSWNEHANLKRIFPTGGATANKPVLESFWDYSSKHEMITVSQFASFKAGRPPFYHKLTLLLNRQTKTIDQALAQVILPDGPGISSRVLLFNNMICGSNLLLGTHEEKPPEIGSSRLSPEPVYIDGSGD